MRSREQDPDHSPVQRLVGQDLGREAGHGSALSGRARQTQRSVEAYLRGGGMPRWMERIADIDARTVRERQRLGRVYRALREDCGEDEAAFAARWRATARAWSFEDLNELIEQHNEWYPIERQLPLNPRTGEYVLVGGRSYRRKPLDGAWVLEQFPAA